MSDTAPSSTNVLLPAARVAVFAQDADIRAIVQSLSDDWRFARVTFDVQDGNVDSATVYYQSNTSPNLLIVETEEIGGPFTEKLEVLASSCSDATAAVVIGPVNDVYLYRKLIDMGVSDYLVRPLQKQVLTELVAKILIEKLGSPGSRLLAFVGAKGGVGTSWMALMTSVLAAEMGEKTVVLDAAGGRSYMSVSLGSEAVTTLHEAARASQSTDQDSFRRMVVKSSENLSVLATGAEAILDDMITPEQFEGIINRLMVTYPLVIVDLSEAPVSLVRAVVTRAHDVVVVSSTTLPSLRAVRSYIQEIKTIRGNVDQGIHLALSGKGVSPGFEISDADIENALKITPALTIPWVPKVIASAESTGKSLDDVQGGKEVLDSVRKFMVTHLKLQSDSPVVAGDDGSASFLGGLLGKIKSK